MPIKSLDELHKMIQLQDPSTREIVREYAAAEYKDCENCYQELADANPSLKPLIEYSRKTKDPIQAIQEAKEQLSVFSRSARGLDAVITMFDGIRGQKESAHNNPVLRLIHDLSQERSSLNIYCEFLPHLEEYYIKLAKSAREIAASAGLEPTKVVQERKYRDQMLKTVFPSRENADTFFTVRNESQFGFLKYSSTLLELITSQGNPLPAELQEVQRILPPIDDITALAKCERTIIGKRLDRVYGTSRIELAE